MYLCVCVCVSVRASVLTIVARRLTAADTVVLITGDGSEASDLGATLSKLSSRPYIALLRVSDATLKPSQYDLSALLNLSRHTSSECTLLTPSLTAVDFKISSLGGKGAPCLQELALKLALNGITTGAHILKGKIYENRMIGACA